jgi:hypothetical protein
MVQEKLAKEFLRVDAGRRTADDGFTALHSNIKDLDANRTQYDAHDRSIHLDHGD